MVRGMIVPGQDQRVHVLRPQDWDRMAGTDFWAFFGPESIAADAAGTLLSDFGWTTTSLVATAGAGGDFLAAADPGTPNHLLTDAGNDLLQSPAVFGDYIHGQLAAQFLGHSPSQLVVEWYGAMTVHSADESTVTGWGLVEAGGAAGTANDRMAWIGTDGTNFICSSAADSDAGATDDAAWHRFRIVVSLGTTDAIEWFIDGVSQGTINLQTDLWPCSFGMFASTTNRPAISWLHAWYA
jgi:hypothetical protein